MDALHNVEARAWLTNNRNWGAFAGNRFWDTERALAFVESLYALGATEVLIEDPRVDAQGNPYADTLLVRCPVTSESRCRLEKFCEDEGPTEVPGDFRMDSHTNGLRLWWD